MTIKFILNLVLLTIFFASGKIHAQHNPDYVDSMVIFPANPTELDTVKVICYSSFEYSTCKLHTSYFSFGSDSIIQLTILQAVGKDSFLCSSIDTITIGRLHARSYILKYALSTSSNVFDTDRGMFTFQVNKSTGIYTSTDKNPAEIIMYPNPALSEFFVNCLAPSNSNYTIMVLDMYGKEVLTKLVCGENINSAERIDISSLPTGIYIVNIKTSNSIWSKGKIIKLQ